MKPKWRFMFEHVSIGAALVLVAVGLVFFGSFMGYLWHSAHFSDLPAFGPEGYGLVGRKFPWWELMVVLLGAGALIYLIRRHTKLYRWPLAVTVGVFLLAFAAASWAAIATPLHDSLANRSLRGGVPIVGGWYRSGQPLVRGLITPGTIKKISDQQWKMITLDDEDVNVKISSTTQIDPTWHPSVGDHVVVIGERNDDTIKASAIRSAERLPHRRPFFIERQPGETIPLPPT